MKKNYKNLNGTAPSTRYLLTRVLFRSEKELVDWILANSQISILCVDNRFYDVTIGEIGFVYHGSSTYEEAVARLRRRNTCYFRKSRKKSQG